MPTYPRIDIPESEKDQNTEAGRQWARQIIDYGVWAYFNQRDFQIQKMNRLNRSYNGYIDPKRTKYLTHTYGKKNVGNFTSYRISRNKIDRLHGEWLRMPLNSTVMTINEEAQSKRLDNYIEKLGNSLMAEDINQMRSMGANVLGGIPVEPMGEKEKEKEINKKTKNESLMQKLLNYKLKQSRLKDKLAENFKDIELVSECFGKIIEDEQGVVDYLPIDPRDAIFEEVEHDYFLKKTPYFGHKERMFIHDILNRFGSKLTDEERERLQNLKDHYSEETEDSTDRRQFWQEVNNTLVVDVFFLQWKTSVPNYTKIFKDNKGKITKEIDLFAEEYQKNEKKIKKDVKAGKYELEKRWYEEKWEGIRIGRDIYTGIQKVKYEYRKQDQPSRVEYDYVGLLFNTRDGLRVSLEELMDNLDFQFDVVQYQIHRELTKAKGKVVVYDKKYLPKNSTLKDVMYGMTNDSLYVIDSSKDGLRMNERSDVANHIKELDLSVSAGTQALINLKLDIMQTIDRITGINEARDGMVAPSAKVGNTQQNVESSNNTTEPMFYFMHRFCEEVFDVVMRKVKINWIYKREKFAEIIAGTDGIEFLKFTDELENEDMGAFLFDGRKESEIRDRLRNMSEAAINAKEFRVMDYLDSELAETLADSKIAIKRGWDELQKLNDEQRQHESEMQDKQLEASKQQAQDDREDWQAHEKEIKQMELFGKQADQDQETVNQMAIDDNKTKLDPKQF